MNDRIPDDIGDLARMLGMSPAPTETGNDARKLAKVMYDQYAALCGAGFTEDQALTILLTMISRPS